MNDGQYITIRGRIDERRIDSRTLEEEIQKAVKAGHRYLRISAFGQHGIGGRLWEAGNETVYIQVDDHPGQRTGAMGFPNTVIRVNGPASDDVGWLNAGAQIIVCGNASNGVANAMAQGKIYIAGNIGARGMTMTKHNPRFDPPELWVLGSVGDYFAEFMAGGIAVICGHKPQNPDNVIGYRPCVGMVGGKIFFRGNHQGFSNEDAVLSQISDKEWEWLRDNLRIFLDKINKSEQFENLSNRTQWQVLRARTPNERMRRSLRSMLSFHKDIWDKELGPGGLIGDLTTLDRSQIPVITTGDLRRFVPVWENRKYKAPCEASCPTGMPVHERWQLIRQGRIDEAIDLALAYTPFPATVCGYLCPNLCMESCTRGWASMPSVDTVQLGKASINARAPELPSIKGGKIAVIGGGPAGISVAWQLRLKGYDSVIFDMAEILGGKISSVIPDSRIPNDVLSKELERVQKIIPHIQLKQKLTRKDVENIKKDYDFIVIAAGAQKPRILPIPGKERMIPALEFLAKAKSASYSKEVGNRVVIIGAGNVGCDAASEAHRLGAKEITLIDIQEPLSFGKERAAAEAAGAKFRYPFVAKEITDKGVKLDSAETIPADTVIISIGDVPDLDFLPENVKTERGFVRVNDYYQTSDPKVFAIGDVVKPGLLTAAIGAGRKAANAIIDISEGRPPEIDNRPMIDRRRIKLEYFDPRLADFTAIDDCGSQCSSCGTCRDCGICEAVCPQGAISRQEKQGDFEMIVDADRCIGCGFCAGACPCGIWNLVENTPME